MTKRIYIYSPSGAVRDAAAFRRGIRRLEKLGYAVEVDSAALARSQRFAGDDAERVAAIHRAADSGADVALITRGGYGLTRILGQIDFQRVASAIHRGTQFVGLSDFTAFQLGLLSQTGAVSWAGPALCEGFGALPVPDDIMEDCFQDLMLGQGEGAGWRQSAQRKPDPLVPTHLEIEDATLWGGNLSVLVGLLGTPYFPNISGGILFVEDVAEHPYRIERMLTQLLLAGVLERQKAVVLGQFSEYRLTPHDKGFNFSQVVRWLRSQTQTPVIDQLPFGHVPTKVLLPVGAKADLVLEGRDVLIAWGHLHT